MSHFYGHTMVMVDGGAPVTMRLTMAGLNENPSTSTGIFWVAAPAAKGSCG
jgi:hypothetical protein